METTRARPRLVAVLLTLLFVAGATGPAHAGLWTGACDVLVQISFRSPTRPPLSSPNYDIQVTGAVDLDPTTPGLQPCVHTLSGEAFGATFAGGSGNALAWSCAGTVARGSWSQSFGAEGPAPFSGTHVLTGPWGAWTLQVQSHSLNVVGVGNFVLQAAEATKTPSCATGSLSSVTMIGTLVFQDP